MLILQNMIKLNSQIKSDDNLNLMWDDSSEESNRLCYLNTKCKDQVVSCIKKMIGLINEDNYKVVN